MIFQRFSDVFFRRFSDVCPFWRLSLLTFVLSDVCCSDVCRFRRLSFWRLSVYRVRLWMLCSKLCYKKISLEQESFCSGAEKVVLGYLTQLALEQPGNYWRDLVINYCYKKCSPWLALTNKRILKNDPVVPELYPFLILGQPSWTFSKRRYFPYPLVLCRLKIHWND